MRLNLQILIVIAFAILLGGATAWFSLQSTHSIGGIKVDAWTAAPLAGASLVDPYTKARSAKNATIPLGATEGLAFNAIDDSRGERLTLKCNYIISGATPPAELWTLTAYDKRGNKLSPVAGAQAEINSTKIIRNADGSFRISISYFPVAGNWLGITGNDEFQLIMRLYDTPATSSTGLVSRRMPSIIRGECVQ